MLETRNYTWRDIFRIPFKVSPVLFSLYVLLDFGQAVLSSLAVVYVTAYFVDRATQVLAQGSAISNLYGPLVLLLSVIAIQHLFAYLFKLVSLKLKFFLERTLEAEMLDRRSSLKYQYIEDADTWELIERLSKGFVLDLHYGIQGGMSVMQSVLSLMSIVAIIVTHVWWAAVILVVVSLPFFKLSLKAGNQNYDAFMEAWPYERRFSYYSDELLLSRETVHERYLFGYTNRLVTHYLNHFEKARHIQEKVSRKFRITAEATGVFMLVIALFISLTLVEPLMSGTLSSGMFIGVLTAVMSLAATLGGTLQAAAKDLSYANAALVDLTTFMSLDLQVGAKDLPDTTVPVFEQIVFRNVSFKYPNSERYILKNLSFQLDANKHYAFVGKNGSGKTTIIKLLTGLYDHYEGEILINGKELRTYPLSTLKAFFSIVYQDFSKYQVSLADNIALGRIEEEPSTASIEQIVQRVGLSDLVQRLDDGVYTPIGKINANGVELSGGQWQKIAIGRSLMSAAPIKILDEPTANLDPLAESLLYQDFEAMMRGKTTFFISHRLGSTKLADEILVIDQGEIVERGSHQQLVAQKGLYNEMFEAQRKWYV